MNIPLSVWKHLAQTCGSVTLADLQAVYLMSIFNGKTHYLQTCIYNIRMTSRITILTLRSTKYLIPRKHSLKILYESKHCPGIMGYTK